ncbi:MAG: hypothetical protein ACI936_000968 [Paraglaciecola sp.]|jgi:hypothetical protein
MSDGYYTDPFKKLSVVNILKGLTQSLAHEDRPRVRIRHISIGKQSTPWIAVLQIYPIDGGLT